MERHHKRDSQEVFDVDSAGHGEPVVHVDHVGRAELLGELPRLLLEEMVEEKNPGVEPWGWQFDRDPVYVEGTPHLLTGRTWEIQGDDVDLVSH